MCIRDRLYGQQTRLHYAVPRTTAPAVPVAADSDTTAISRFNTQTNTANIKNPFVIPGLKKIIIDVYKRQGETLFSRKACPAITAPEPSMCTRNRFRSSIL